MVLKQSADRNAFLADLPVADYELLRPHLTYFNLTAGAQLQEHWSTVEQVVFPYGGLVALTMPSLKGGSGGALLLGCDGVLGAFGAAAGVPAVCDAEVYVSGPAARLPASAFRYLLDQSPTIRRLIARYHAALIVQAHQTALCNAVHPVEARLSRLLVDVQDRCGGLHVPLTQVAMSQLIGVTRPTTNFSVRKLQKAGLIHCGRGHVQIIRREQLERHACECYRAAKEYISLLHSLPAGTAAHPVEPLGHKAV